MPEEYLVSDPHLLPLEAQWRAYLGGSFSDGYLGPPDRMSLSVPVITPDRERLWLVVSRCSGAPLLSGWLFCNGSDWKEEDVCPISAPGCGRLFSHYCGTCCTYRDAPYPQPPPPTTKKKFSCSQKSAVIFRCKCQSSTVPAQWQGDKSDSPNCTSTCTLRNSL